MNQRSPLRIGELARLAKVTPRTIRFYVQEGLLPEPVKTQKNLALYNPDCADKIRAIKIAQTERFLPLTVIRELLQRHSYDYSVLTQSSDPVLRPLAGIDAATARSRADIPGPVIERLGKKGWTGRTGKPTPGDLELMRLLGSLNKTGVDWPDLEAALEQIQDLVDRIAEVEISRLIAPALSAPGKGIGTILAREEAVVSRLIAAMRRKSLSRILQRRKEALDNAYLASADEGFALPAEEIAEEMKGLEQRLRPRKPDARILNDLAIGCSCAGDLQGALGYLRRVRRNFPDHVETRLRWIWYRRFASRPQDQNRLRTQLARLVAAHPDYALAHGFMAVWQALEIMEAEDPYQSLDQINACLSELAKAAALAPNDLHDEVLIRYIHGRILTVVGISNDHLAQGIDAFEGLLTQRGELARFYATRMPFFPRWLWPNIYCFLGEAYNAAGLFDLALGAFGQAGQYRALDPYRARVRAGIDTATSKMEDKGENR